MKHHFITRWLPMLILIFTTPAVNAQSSGPRLIFSDDFDHLDTAFWAVELQAGPDSEVSVQKGKLILDTRAGVTVWLKKKLRGDVEITYRRRVIMQGGKNDRLSDLNQFWMATDPQRENLFTRTGKFEEYDSLELYYVGMGGNSNTTTRFRKYAKSGQRNMIGEFRDSAHLLRPNHYYQIRITVRDSVISFFVDGLMYFAFHDDSAYTEGYFGFRSTGSHQEIDDFKVYQLGE